jgi:hypothetical protein
MNRNNKHLPYPFLSTETDDYNNVKFSVLVKPEINDIGWKLDLKITLEDDDLKNHISNQNAFYHLVIDCKSTGFRKIIRSHETKKNIQVEILKSDIKNKISIEPFIVAKEDFPLCSRNFNHDYQGRSFNVKKSELLAEAEPIELHEPEVADPLEPLESLVKIEPQKLNEQKTFIWCGLAGNNIVIYLNENDHKNYRNLMGAREDSVLLSMLLIPSLMQAINEIVKENVNYENLKWYRKLESTIYETDKKFKEIEREEWDTFEIAQRILNSQIGIALQQRFEYLTSDED